MKKIIFSFAFLMSCNFVYAAGDAGCGLGSLIIKSNTKLMQLFAVTTNGTFASQTFGITSGTSNCTAHGLVKNEKEQIIYAEANYQHLISDMARGSGETLDTLASMMGCEENSIPAIGELTRSNYEKIVSPNGASAVKVLDAIKGEIKNNQKLAVSCKQLG